MNATSSQREKASDAPSGRDADGNTKRIRRRRAMEWHFKQNVTECRAKSNPVSDAILAGRL